MNPFFLIKLYYNIFLHMISVMYYSHMYVKYKSMNYSAPRRPLLQEIV